MNVNKRKLFSLVLLTIGLSLLYGCQGEERRKEIANTESQVQLDAEKKALEARASIMESDLTERQRFYQGVAGVYEGTATGTSGTYQIRIRLVSSLSPYSSGRIRLPEEIASDLNNLTLSAQVLQWNGQTKIGAVGCRVGGIRPDIANGIIQIASSECPNFYFIQISDAPTNARKRGAMITKNDSQNTASSLLKGNISSVASIGGEIQPTSSSDQLTFSAERVSQ